jgi:hypothetical protein
MDTFIYRYEGDYNNKGKKEGIWRGYFVNDSLAIETNYKNGVANGPVRAFEINGIYHSEGNFKNEEKDGLWKYYENEKVIKTENYSNGKLNGSVKEYDPDTSLLISETNYKDGVVHGYYELRDRNDVIIKRGIYNNGRKYGPWLYREEKGKNIFATDDEDSIIYATSTVCYGGDDIRCPSSLAEVVTNGDRRDLENAVGIVTPRARAYARSSVHSPPRSKSPKGKDKSTSKVKKLSKNDIDNIKEHNYRVVKLKNLLRERGMPLSGNKDELEARLLALDS